MHIEKTHFIDADDDCEYSYEGDIYRVTCAHVTYVCRAYRDEPKLLAFMASEVDGRQTMFTDIPYADDTFKSCIQHFRTCLGFTDFTVLIASHGYEAVMLENFKAAPF